MRKVNIAAIDRIILPHWLGRGTRGIGLAALYEHHVYRRDQAGRKGVFAFRFRLTKRVYEA
jgi:hypothetical protein